MSTYHHFSTVEKIAEGCGVEAYSSEEAGRPVIVLEGSGGFAEPRDELKYIIAPIPITRTPAMVAAIHPGWMRGSREEV